MPNWCDTSICFQGNKHDIQILHDKVVECTSRTYIQTDFGTEWLGNLLYGVGLQNLIDNKSENIRCRGWILFVGDVEKDEIKNEWRFVVDEEVAWSPMLQIWRRVINELNLDIKINAIYDEIGMCIHGIYDPDNINYFDYDLLIYAYVETKEDMDKMPKELKEIVGDGEVRYRIQDFVTLTQNAFNTDRTDLSFLISLVQGFFGDGSSSYIHFYEYERDDDITHYD